MISKITLKITGRNSDYFLNTLISKNINFTVSNKTRKDLVITVTDNDYKKIKNIKTSYNIKVIRVYGLLYIKYLIKNINCPHSYENNCKNECNICRLIDNDNLPSFNNNPIGIALDSNTLLA